MPLIEEPDQDWPHPAVVTYEQGNVGVAHDQWNYIRYRNGAEELYDRRADPNEWNNLIATGLGDYRELVNQLRTHIPEVRRAQPPREPRG